MKFHEDQTMNVVSEILTRFLGKPYIATYDIIKTNLLTMFHEDRTKIRPLQKNAPSPGCHVFQQTRTILKLIQDSIRTHVLTNVNKENAPPPGGHVFQTTLIIFRHVQDIIGTNLLTKFHDDRTISVASRVLTRKNDPPPLRWRRKNLLTKFHAGILNAPFRGAHFFQPTRTIFELVQNLIGTKLLIKFHDDRTKKLLLEKKSCWPCFSTNQNHFQLIQEIIGTELIQDIIGTNLTKFNEDWTINVASRVLTKKIAPPPLQSYFIGKNLLTRFHEDRTISVNLASSLLPRQMFRQHDAQRTKGDQKSSPNPEKQKGCIGDGGGFFGCDGWTCEGVGVGTGDGLGKTDSCHPGLTSIGLKSPQGDMNRLEDTLG
ncbi:hypothetical protein DPMN_006809 [Dreissena polymorpha]|uniref:Uncharacterized protein n=1 Tax=Dreissena polymorpha TaxID=45954 RepID=A0A9D4MUY8_DREPO|nr:hypothetical protein DPMN_006809 [Dreissena polymorpha]